MEEHQYHIHTHNKKIRNAIETIGGIIVLGVILMLIVPSARPAWVNKWFEQPKLNTSTAPNGIWSQPRNEAVENDAHDRAITNAVERANPAVVSITISKNVPILERCPIDPFRNLPPEFQQLFGDNFPQFYQPCQKGTEKREIGGGSGFIVTSDGYIVTNKHVVSDTKAEYTVLTNDGKKYDATVVARHPVLDVAIVKIKASGLSTLPLGDSDAVKLGQTAIAIGNALGEFRNTVSVGVVSGLARSVTAVDGSGDRIETIDNVIQTDAAINPGNSGGPLLDIGGNVIGMNTAMVSGAQSIGFAIPINAIKKSIDAVIHGKTLKAAYLGVRYISLNEEIAKQYNISQTQGALIKGSDQSFAVEPNSPAASAGIREGDVIVSFDGKKIDADTSLSYLISQKSPGDSVTLEIVRNGKTISVQVELGERKE